MEKINENAGLIIDQASMQEKTNDVANHETEEDNEKLFYSNFYWDSTSITFLFIFI